MNWNPEMTIFKKHSNPLQKEFEKKLKRKISKQFFLQNKSRV
jgi:hypothetical protein